MGPLLLLGLLDVDVKPINLKPSRSLNGVQFQLEELDRLNVRAMFADPITDFFFRDLVSDQLLQDFFD